VDVSGLTSGVSAIAVGDVHTCALMDAVHGGGVKCWGINEDGQLGDGTNNDSSTPVDVIGLTSGVSAISAGYAYTCALMDAVHGSGVKCWGSYFDGQLDDYTSGNSTTPVDVSGLTSGVSAISAGMVHTCVLMDAVHGGGVKCWGINEVGQLGDGTNNHSSTPVDVSGLTEGVTAISAGGKLTCALMDAVHGGGVKCWGANSEGELGDGTNNHSSTPVDVVGLKGGISAIAVGAQHACALTTLGRVKCWGSNNNGQLGWTGNRWDQMFGTTGERHTPVDVSH
jgi:alpha-tubulin suppressor-like RCC1 family protein